MANLGRVSAAEGNHEAALRLHEEALQVSRELRNVLSTVRSLLHCATAQMHLGQATEAYGNWREAAELALDSGLHEQARQAIDAMTTLVHGSAADVEHGAPLRDLLNALPVGVHTATPT